MASALQYIIDDSGQKTSVLVPFKVWKNLNDNYQKLLTLNSINEGLKEVQLAKKSSKKLQTLKFFLK